jgi:hypothetical protein
MASDVLLLCVFAELSPNSRLDIVGGVFEPLGVGRVGVCGLPVTSTEIPSAKSFMVMIAVIERGATAGTRICLCDPGIGVLNCQRVDPLTRPSVFWPLNGVAQPPPLQLARCAGVNVRRPCSWWLEDILAVIPVVL